MTEPDSRPGTFKGNGLPCDYIPDDPRLQVLSLRLLDAETGELEGTLRDGDVLNLDADPTVVLDATTTAGVSSIVWQSNGIVENVENTAPWGDRISHYEPGLNDIALVPYSEDDAAGSSGTPLELTIQIQGYGIDATSSRITRVLITDTLTSEETVLEPAAIVERSITRFLRAETFGAVQRVEFRSDGEVIGVATQAPFEISTEELPPGEQELLVFPFESNGFRTEFVQIQLTVR